jgi:hypothetical protein
LQRQSCERRRSAAPPTSDAARSAGKPPCGQARRKCARALRLVSKMAAAVEYARKLRPLGRGRNWTLVHVFAWLNTSRSVTILDFASVRLRTVKSKLPTSACGRTEPLADVTAAHGLVTALRQAGPRDSLSPIVRNHLARSRWTK